MKIGKLIENISIKKVFGYKEVDASGVEIDDRKDIEGKVFVCLKGNKADGHDHAKHAVEKGAVAVFSEKELSLPVPVFIVQDTRKAFAVLCGNYYGNPAKKMDIVTVVGTNGKTSTTEILSAIFTYAGIPSATIGTLGYKIGEERSDGELTTPDPISLHRHLAEMCRSGIKCVFMEASAHAIYYDKLAGIKAKVGILTNITQDHLDFFGDMEHYAAVKLSYFNHLNTSLAVVNSDDPFGVKLLNNKPVPVITYGINNPADVFAIDVEEGEKGLTFTINAFDCIEKIRTPLHGLFNVYNVMAATAAAMYMGISLSTVRCAVAGMSCVPGRYNVYYVNGIKTIVDYAHTPDGLENLLCDVRREAKGKVVTVFGCGGDRDKAKRPIMGRIASRYSDHVIITEDNPRSEDESMIAYEILRGVAADSMCEVIDDRATAIRRALQLANEEDTVVIAGKGHEKYIEKKGVKIPYSDVQILKESEK